MRVMWSRALTCMGCGSDAFDTKLYMIYILNDVVHHCKKKRDANPTDPAALAIMGAIQVRFSIEA